MPVSSAVSSGKPLSLSHHFQKNKKKEMKAAKNKDSNNNGNNNNNGKSVLDDSSVIEEDMSTSFLNYDGDNDVKPQRRIPRRQRTRSPLRRGHSNKSTRSMDGSGVIPGGRGRRGMGAKQNSARSVNTEPDPLSRKFAAERERKKNNTHGPLPDSIQTGAAEDEDTATPLPESTTAAAEADGPVVVKNLVRNLRLSRNLSRVLPGSRSPSPSRKLLAAEIVVAAAKREVTGPIIPPTPPLEQTPLLMMRFTNKAPPKLITLVENRLVKSGLIIHDKLQGKEDWEEYTYLYLTAAQEALEALAEQVRWMKRTNDTAVVEYFTVTQRRKFINKKAKSKNQGGPNSRYRRNNNQNKDQQQQQGQNALGGDELFTSNEWCHLAFRLLDSVEVFMDTESSSELNLMLMLKEDNPSPMDYGPVPPPPPPPPHANPGSPPNRRDNFIKRGKRPSFGRQGSNGSFSSGGGGGSHHKRTKGGMPNRRALRKQRSMQNLEGPSSSSSEFNRRQNFHRQKSIMLQRVQQHGKRSSCLRHVLQANDYVDVVTPLHWGPARDAIVAETWKPRQLTPPIQDIRNYYGEDVAFYFAWMGYLSTWLVVLGVMGSITAIFRWFRGDNVDEDEFTPLYGIFAFVWGVLFLRFWERQEHRLAYRWGTYSLSLYDKQKCLTTRPQFRGRLRISPVTGDYETYYPTNRRRGHYAVSALVTMVMLTVAFWMMILSLNMQGYIHPERNPERWHPHNPHPFHFPTFATLSEPGHLFDAKHPWRSFIPTIIHVAVIFTLNSLYRIIATALTDWENHETEASYRTSLIVKRFAFEAFDCYVALFYLAFYERDVYRLQMELATVFNIDTFRRLAMECFVPIMEQKFSKWWHHHAHEQDKRRKIDKRNRAAALGRKSTTTNANKKPSEEKAAGNDNKTVANNKDGSSPSSVATSTSSLSEPEIDLSPSKKNARFEDGNNNNNANNANNNTTNSNKPKRQNSTETARPGRGAGPPLLRSRSISPSSMAPWSSFSKRNLQQAAPPTLDELADEAEKDEYEAFDDYMEIVIQFGYVTLFASAYPLASVVALAANWVEIRSDCFKLARVCRRPRSFRADGIGVWKSLLSCVVWLSALTNCLIVGFTSDQMKEIFPAFYMVDKHGDTHLVHDKGWIAVFVIFGLERLLIVTGLLIYAVVPEVPEDVQDEVERLHYIRHQEHEDVLRQVMRKRNKKKAV